MHVLLINPWIIDFAAYDFWARPLGLLYTGAFLEARGHSIRLVDCLDRFQPGVETATTGSGHFNTGKFRREIIPKPDCLKHVPRNYNRYGISHDLFDSLVADGVRPDVILVSCVMTYWYRGAFEAIERVRMLLPDVPIVLGGIYATLCHGHARDMSGADLVVTGGTPSEIVRSIEQCTGITGSSDDTPDSFDQWPEPAWHLYTTLPTATIMTTRGCPMRCTVCASRLLFDGFERRDPLRASRAILELAGRGVEDCAFVDDALLIDADRYAACLFEDLARNRSTLRLHTPNGLHVREITPSLARLMKRAGVATVRLSLESSSDERIDDFSGKVSREEFRRAAAALFDAGYAPRDLGAYVIAGLPGQKLDEVEDTIAFAHSCRVPVRPALFSPVPGTAEFVRAVAAGMIAFGSDPLLHNNTLRTTDWFPGGEPGYRAFRMRVTAENENVIG